jgi:protocatechuate 3,4-dioxygenase beta subunit
MPTLRRGALAAVLLWTAGCGSDGTGPDAAEIVVSPSPITIAQSQTAQLSVSVLDSDGSLITGVAVTFRSNDESIVTVNATGLVTSVGKAGATTVSVRSTGLTENVPVTVTATSSGITLGPNPAVVPQGSTLQLEAVVTDAVGDPVPGAQISFTTSNALVATVSATGLVTAVGPAGQATVYAQSGALVGQTAVVVTQVPTTLELAPTAVTLGSGHWIQLAARVLDAEGSPIAGRPIAFSAAPASLLEVSSGGVVTSKGPLGSGSVTAQSGELEATIAVSVIATARPNGTIREIVPLSGIPYGAAISNGNVLLVASLDGTLHRAQLPSLTFTNASTPGLTTDVAVNPAGTRAWVSNAPGGHITEYDVTGGTPVALRSVEIAPADLYGIEVSADGGTVFVGTGNGQVYPVDVGSGAVGTAVEVGGGVVHVTLGAGGGKVYASSPGSGRVMEIDVATFDTREFTLAGYAGQGVVTSTDGTELYVANEVGALEIFDIATQARTVVPLDCGGYGLGITPDNTHLYLSCSSGDYQVKIIDRASRAVVKSLALPGVGRRVAVAPDGATVVVATEAGSIVVIE